MTTFATLLPDAEPLLRQLGQTWPAALVKANFPHVQVAHLVSLFLLGGCVVVLNLRLLGVGLDERPSAVERHLRHVLHLAAAGAVVTGLLMAVANPMKLYLDTPFLVKMTALLAGLIVTYAVTLPVARAEGVVGRPALAFLAVALGVWSLALWVFASTVGASPGVIHVLFAAALVLVLALPGRARWIYLSGLAAILAAHQVVTHVVITDPYDVVRLDPANKAFIWAEALWVLGFAAYLLIAPRRAADTGAMARLAGLSAILIWVTVAAAGRWIAFG